MVGLSEGDKKTIEIEASEAYGELREDLIQEVGITQLPENVQVGDRLQAQAENGNPIPVVVTEINGGKAKVDANHPLAGKNLIFDVEVVEVV